MMELEKMAESLLAQPDLAIKSLERLPNAVLHCQEGVWIYANQEAEHLSGYHRSEIIGQPVEMLVPETARAAHVSSHRPSFELAPRRRPMGFGPHLALRHRSGVEVPVSIMLEPIAHVGGLVTMVVIRRLEPELA